MLKICLFLICFTIWICIGLFNKIPMLLFKENISLEMTAMLFLSTAGNKSFFTFYILVVLFGFAFTKMQMSWVQLQSNNPQRRKDFKWMLKVGSGTQNRKYSCFFSTYYSWIKYYFLACTVGVDRWLRDKQWLSKL